MVLLPKKAQEFLTENLSGIILYLEYVLPDFILYPAIVILVLTCLLALG